MTRRTHGPDGSPLVALADVKKMYPGEVTVEVLKGCTLAVGRGEFVAVTGPSGSGKTTLLNVIGLLDRPDSGSYRFAGTEMALANEVERTTACSSLIGFVFQTFELIDHRTASENVELPLVYHGLSPRQRQRRAFETLRRVGLAHRAHAYPPTLSGGEKQRVAVARSVVGEPELILCDEPTGNLDDGSTASVLELLAELNGEGLTIVVATHDPRVASRAHRELAVSDGRILR